MIALMLAIQAVTIIGLIAGGVALYRHITADDRHYSHHLKEEKP